MPDRDTSTPTVRTARADDVEAITALHMEVQRMHHEAEPLVYKAPRADASRDLVKARLADPTMHYFVAEAADGHIAGFLLAAARPGQDTPLTHARPFVEVDEMCVAPAYRRRGVAQSLSDQAARWALQQGIGEVRLSVRGFNQTAQRAYACMGFLPIQHRLSLALED